MSNSFTTGPFLSKLNDHLGNRIVVLILSHCASVPNVLISSWRVESADLFL